MDHSGEVLRPYAHNIPNTHLISEGEMTVWKMRSARGTEHSRKAQSSTSNPTCAIGRRLARKNAPSSKHKDLSPTAAKRFVKWESFIKMDTEA